MNDLLTNYQSIPFWSWNDELNEEQLIAQIDSMKERGVGGFIMHARGGLKTPYLSEDWMKCVDVCVNAAKERNMQAWIYDENGWPSGFVGGKLLEKEENRDAYITHRVGDFDSSAWLVYSMETEKLHLITEPIQGECLNLYLHISPSTVDILNEDVVEQFLTETHEKYATRYGIDFSEKIAGFFSDEPQYYRWNTAYTRVMPQEYKARYGEELFEGLGLLFVKKEGYRTFRYRYWYTMQQLMLNNFAKKVYDWCEKHNVRFTGHYIEETSLGFQMACCGGVMPFYEFMHMPGIDWLGRRIGNKIPLRQVASVAQQLGKKQVLTETYGCCGWDVTPSELKCIGEFQYIGGVNRTCQHLLPYSERGQRKRDYPAHFSEINPWIESDFKTFNDYFTELGYLLANAKEVVNVAMLHPIRSAYFDYQDDGIQGRASIRELEEEFYKQHERLSQEQIPYHFLDETLLEQHGFVNGNKIGCGLCEYEYLILPTCYTMGCHTEKLIRQYVENGGKVLLLGEKPAYREGEAYDYSYLESNISYEQIIDNLPYKLIRPVAEVHSTLRKSEQGYFLFVQNYGQEAKVVSYQLANEYISFEKQDFITKTSTVISPDVELKAGESCLLKFSKKVPEELPIKMVLHLEPVAEVIDVTDNYLPIDNIQYAKDGLNYSEDTPCMGVFQQLLQERYHGPLYIKYTFEVNRKPSEFSLIVEKCKDLGLSINGKNVVLKENWERDHQFLRGDITSYVIVGVNEIVRRLDFYQSEDVYYALFGEGVTESLLNCLSYDTEIEPIYLAGQFGVYAKDIKQGKRQDVLLGEHFYIDKAPTEIENLVIEGYPFFSGRIKLRREVILEQTDVVLEFQGRFQAMKVHVNGKQAGSLLLNNQLDISEFTRIGTNEIILDMVVGNRNLFGPHHWLLNEEPETVGPNMFELPKTWKEGKSDQYRDSYALVKVALY